MAADGNKRLLKRSSSAAKASASGIFAVSDAKKTLHKCSSATNVNASHLFAVSDSNKRLSKRSSSAVTANANLPATHSSKRLSLHTALAARRSAPKRLGEASLDMLKEVRASCQDLEMDAEIEIDRMLKYQELKFKSYLPNLSEVLSDAEARMPSKKYKGYVFKGLQELKEAAQRKVPEADLVDVAQLVSITKAELPIDNQAAVNSIFNDAQPLDKATQRSNGAWPQLPDISKTNYLMFRKGHLHQSREKVSDGGQWQKDLRTDAFIHPRPPLPCNCNFSLHLASCNSTKSTASCPNLHADSS